MSNNRTIVKNISANYIGVIGMMVIAFFLSPFLVKNLGDSRFGIWTILSALTGYMSLLDLGIASAVTRYVARHNRRNEHEVVNSYINSALFLFVMISIGLVAFSSVFATQLVSLFSIDTSYSDTVRILIIIVSFDVSLFVIAGVYRGAFGGLQRFEIINAARLTSATTKAILYYVVVTRGEGLVAMAYVSLAANAGVLVFYTFVLKRLYSGLQFSKKYVQKESVKNIFDFGKFVFLTMITNQLLNFSGTLLAGIFLSATAVTYYSFPWLLSAHSKRLTLAISQTFTPAFSALDAVRADDDSSDLYKSYIHGTRVMLVFSTLLCVGMLSMGADFIKIWIGESYAEVAAPLIIFLFVTFYFDAPHMIGVSLLQAMAQNKRYAQATMVVAVISLASSIFFLKIYGLVGIVIGASIPQVIFYGLLSPWYLSRYIFKRPLVEYWLSTHLRTAAPAVALYFSLAGAKSVWPPNSFLILFSIAIVCTLIYFALVFVISLNRSEKDQAIELLRALRRTAK
jgi:O-antigen/teichoic acid export membrane protein